MRIALSIDGGLASFPGLRKPQTIECEQLAPDRQARLRALVEQARFFTATAARGAAAARTCAATPSRSTMARNAAR